MSALNPWQSKLKLDAVDGFTPDKALTQISQFLTDWPGTQTANADLEVRHNRFIQVIGGYPSINGRFPLDMPLHPDSIKALNLSRYLDTISGGEGTSLRSRILDRDIRFKRELQNTDLSPQDREGMLLKTNQACVSDLLKYLRIQDNEDSEKELIEPLSNSEERLLISLHSLDATQLLNHWPWDAMAMKIEENHHYCVRFGDSRPTREEGGEIVEEFGHESKEYIQHKNLRKAWDHYVYFEGDVEFVFEYAYIKTWMQQHWLQCWSDKQEGSDSLGQRLMRGLSAICELAISRIRQVIITSYGLGSIVVDGGGRISFTVPHEEVTNAENMVRNAFDRMFLIEESSRERPYLEHDINQALRYHLNVGNRPVDKEKRQWGPDRLFYEDYTDNLSPNFVRKSMPPRRFYIYKKGSQPPEPEIESTEIGDCKLCNCTVEKWATMEKNVRTHEYPMCTMHRLIFVIGTNQRIRDSILRDSEKAMGYGLGKEGKKTVLNRRRVHSVSVIDGNSIGVLFQQDSQAINDLHDFDIRRRRSFRFNSIWFCSLAMALGATREFGADRIAAWVSAGDDLVLAQYGPMQDSGES
ncbi:MAG: hypothetical protein VYA86_03210, partial [Candidatus Thermoplasmatota archaeon]|nr:hypothetical protein [Candidatus Thermoplasmatota archaeon]